MRLTRRNARLSSRIIDGSQFSDGLASTKLIDITGELPNRRGKCFQGGDGLLE